MCCKMVHPTAQCSFFSEGSCLLLLILSPPVIHLLMCSCLAPTLSSSLAQSLPSRRGLPVVLVARDAKALEEVAELVRREGREV